jgi:hypothetical protein
MPSASRKLDGVYHRSDISVDLATSKVARGSSGSWLYPRVLHTIYGESTDSLIQ